VAAQVAEDGLGAREAELLVGGVVAEAARVARAADAREPASFGTRRSSQRRVTFRTRALRISNWAGGERLAGREPGTQVFHDLVENPADESFPGIAVLRLDGGLFFATAEALEDRIRKLPQDGRRALVLSLEGVNFVDSQGSAKLAEMHRLTQADGVTLRLARVKPHVRAGLETDGVVDLLGADHIHGNVHRAVEAQLDSSGEGGILTLGRG
jgi:anti-anti-sigma factor